MSLSYFKFLGLGLVFLITLNSQAAAKSKTMDDNYLWLEEVTSQPALDWVKKHNEKSLKYIQSQPHYAGLYSDLKAIYLAKDRVAYGSYSDGWVYNFWQDEKNKHGLWRRTTLDEYRKAQPNWDVLLDYDDLSTQEKEEWVAKGQVAMSRHSNRVLVMLSRGGKDAVEVREFDLKTRKFVADGFWVKEAKTHITPLNDNEVLIGTDFGKNTLTKSGYPRILKHWARGTSLEQAQTILEASEDDLSVSAWVSDRPEGKLIFVSKGLNFFEAENYLYDQKTHLLKKLLIPTTAEVQGVIQDEVLFTLRYDLKVGATVYQTGSLMSLAVGAKKIDQIKLVYEPSKLVTVSSVSAGKNTLFLTIFDNVRGKLLELKKVKDQWQSHTLDYPDFGTVSIGSLDVFEDIMMVYFNSFLEPYSQYLQMNAGNGSGSIKELLKQSPKRFDASNLEAQQFHTKSKDGVKIPYFLVAKKGLKLDQSNPTLLYGYGGFEVSQTPNYLTGIGKAWLERGGVYVLANIRGGGEFGPKWHQAALKENRQKAFDDFIAVAEDLLKRKITTPEHLGIMGGSNGGLLMGATFTQRPELFKAVVCQVPLLDMLRFHKLLAGASWQGEYGSPDDPKMHEIILKYSPYQNIKPAKELKYPQVFFVTSTKDDRVHPGHARKMVARLEEMGHAPLLFERIQGGHAASTTPLETAERAALEYSFLWSQLK